MPNRDEAPVGAPCWIEIFSSDIGRARSFYGELFGWESEDAGEEFGHYINFTKGGVGVAGGMANDGSTGAPDAWSIYLATDDVEKTAELVASNGGQAIVEPMPVADLGTMGVFVDPGGAVIGAWQPGTMKGFGILGETDTPAWFELHTRAYGDAVKFYEDVFGWDTHVASDSDELRYTTFGEGDEALAGVMDDTAFPGERPSFWTVYFATDDADATVAKAVELGGGVMMPPEDTPYGRLAVCTDATGAVFSLMQDLDS